MADARPWSLAGRLTRVFLASTLTFIFAISAASAWFLLDTTKQEIDALVVEEMVEMCAAFRILPYDQTAFDDMVQAEKRRHPLVPMGWRVWAPEKSETLAERGDPALLTAEWPAREPLNTTHVIDRTRRWRTATLDDGTAIGVSLDGAIFYERLERFATTALVLLVVAFALNVVLARLFFARVSALLRSVAARTRQARLATDTAHIHVEGAPEEIRDIADALRETLDKIHAETEQSRVFTAGIAHELRSPVQNLIGATEVALLSARTAETYREVLHSNLEELRSLGDAVDNLVTMCSEGETRRTSVREEFDVAYEARIRLRREHDIAERAGIKLELEIEGDTRLDGDREAILRALRNVTQNAIQWSPRGGRVDVRIVGSASDVRVTVDDEGPGVPLDLRARIFEPFFRGPSAQGRRVGYGLGLALSKSAAEDQGGSIDVGESPRGGARFVIVLPKRQR
jgi:signal transduction histidine kinase